MKGSRFAMTAVAAAMVGVLGFSAPALAAQGYGKVKVDRAADSVTIGNDAFARTFSWKNNKLTTTEIDNKLGKTKLVPGEGSEEFVLENVVVPDRQEPATPLVSVKLGSVRVHGSSEQADEGGHPSALAVDGDPQTYWASTAHDDPADPTFEVDFGRKVSLSTIVYTPRYDASAGYECTGQVLKVDVQKKTGDTWTSVKQFTLKSGKQGCAKQDLQLDSAVETTAIRLVVKESYHWQEANKNKIANIAELDCLDADGTSLIGGVSAGRWTVKATSDQGASDGGGINALIDGNTGTYWHSRYNDVQGVTGTKGQMPVNVTLDRGASAPEFSTLGYFPRSTSANGNWEEFELYAADSEEGLFSPENAVKAADGSTTFKVSYAGMYGSGAEAGAKWNYFGLEKACDKRFVGISVTKGQGGGFAAGGEVDLFGGEAFTSCDMGGSAITASSLTVKGEPKVENVEHEINGTAKSGKLVTFSFEPFAFGTDDNAVIEQKVVMYDGDHFMRKWIELKTADKDARIKYIDGEHIDMTGVDDDKMWTIPTDNGGVVAMPMQRANLGQPFYANGMFFGSEFPAADTQIKETDEVAKAGLSRFWSGKNFTDFARDGQLTKDGKYVSWQTVSGASHSDGSNNQVIQSDFFAYINSISKPSDFRIQYNSWFDNMMFIDDENIIESFKAVDKELSETGVRPLESYVVDDGWNQYRRTEDQLASGDDLRRNGPVGGERGVNTEGFWQFNNKFPEGLTPSSALVRKLGSNFGVWVGPRGGYNYYGNLADIIARAGKGSAAGGSIDVADQRYVENFEKMATDWMKQYGVNYWKWDGFADNAQYSAFAQGENVAGYDAGHQHMYGGPNGAFHTTDLWEKWIGLFEEVWKTADAEQIQDLWISLTCYLNPSPWYLQWSNSVWLQCVGDRGEVHGGAGNDKMNAMLTYRDACYYEFINTNQYQFPLANVYNHDPIYGKEGTGIDANSMDGEQFRNYMFMQGTRGTAFWELYYSDSIFNDEKYLINADFLEWEEGNFDMLRNAKWIGGDPASNAGLTSNPTVGTPGTQEAYGFSGFNVAGNEGIISMRNPANAPRTIEFNLDAAVGCTEPGTYKVVRDHVYTQGGNTAAAAPASIEQGAKVSMTLQPGETQVWHLSKDGDTTAPTLSKLYAENNTTLRVQASEHVYGAQLEVTVNGEKVELSGDAVKAYADLKTFDITLPAAPADGASIEVKAVAGSDAAGNELAGSVSRKFHTDGVVVEVVGANSAALASASSSIEGSNGFAVTATVESVAPNTTLVSQGEEWSLAIDGEGKARFTVGDVVATSETKVSAAQSITGVRENNGMLKVYVGGEIEGNGYDAKNSVDHKVKEAPITLNTKAGIMSAAVYDRSLGYDEVPSSPLADLVTMVEGLKPSVSQDSWNNAKIDELLQAADEALKNGDPSAQMDAYKNLLAGYNKLVPGIGELKAENLALNKDVVARWTEDDGNAANSSDMPVSKAVDGTKNTSTQYGQFGRDNVAKSAYLQVDLGEVAQVDQINMVRYYADGRTYRNTTIVLSEDEKFDAKDTIVYNSDAENLNGFGEGADRAYPETAEGKSFNVKDGARARYVRVYMNGQDKSKTTNHVVEIEVMGTRSVHLGDPYGVAELDELIARADAAIKSGSYTDGSLKALEKPLAAAKELSAKAHQEIEEQQFTLTFGEVAAVKSNLENALAGLELKPGVPEPPVDPENPVDPEPPVDPENPVDPVPPVDPENPVDPVPPVNPENPGDTQGGSSVKPNPEQNKPGMGAQSGSSLPKTGDNSLFVVGGLALVAIGVSGAGAYLKRRHG